jgi:hypothetical protein
MYEYKVGQPYNPNVKNWPETPQYNYRQGEHELVLFFNKPSISETLAVKQGKAEFALTVKDDIIFFLYRFGQPVVINWSDAPYTWHLVPEAERTILPEQLPATGEKRVLLRIILVDATTGLICAIRIVTLSPSFTSRLNQAILEQSQKPFDAKSYDMQLQQAYRSYPESSQLLKLAIARSNN